MRIFGDIPVLFLPDFARFSFTKNARDLVFQLRLAIAQTCSLGKPLISHPGIYTPSSSPPHDSYMLVADIRSKAHPVSRLRVSCGPCMSNRTSRAPSRESTH